ncbi:MULTISPECIES: Fic family protein [unclassified Hyphomonas]|jgi:Fic family protein|uniref:Fic family protein n=1 Tax=unclassified Hyphomonas TaxID=2630699 RepID=UPI000C3E009D|nr:MULTISPECIES: Fic family protein [unclassified Hyphomonas]MAL43302.1 cell filamentation protein Fic [Hyphomonas sp.]MAX82603.1 cell filamentation protein Fic [Hyphomonas sp.]HBJ39733.1 cell filamentation protein Fic [Hyphomonas sp.]HCE24042.1 cell filamentation protein Fic [Hyphomonas sp.]HCX12417.1 cell filamentation protein Fic [Hyphomonas sp.]|tara:strand:- start:5182 stop:6411 length:1230 start_codon:yes stop_codon:yes gene_type:complete
MTDKEPDTKADIVPAEDRGEGVGAMEPMLVGSSSHYRGQLGDLAVEVAERSAGLRRSLPDGVVTALSDLVRAMNCYYSNLIEGHDTHPIDIERALNNDFSADAAQRDLQLEAKAHIEVQAWIDGGGLEGRATSADAVMELHRRFCENLPDDLLWADNPDTGERVPVVPGAYRTRDVQVGRHVAISSGAIPRFMERFENAYARLGRVDALIAAAAAHHRLLWIHPFVDGNGRVVRLMSYAMLRDALDTGGIWSVARGLARREAEYKAQLQACDGARRGDLDGRGTLSEEALARFAVFFLEVCLDQIKFMEGLVEPGRLRDRILLWTEEEVRVDRLPPKSGLVLEALLYRGVLPRGDVADLLSVGDRQARRVTSALIDAGVVTADTTRAPLKLAFPAKLAARWMPGLFPEK